MKLRTVPGAAVCFALLSMASVWSSAKQQEQAKDGSDKLVQCTMDFEMRSWSAFYKSSKGEGTITCDNDQTSKVRLKAKGGGLTVGKSDIIGGNGTFSGARNIHELFGSYAQSEAHAGVGPSASAQALTKGPVSLVLNGTGRGVDLGFSFGKFTITPAK